MKQNLLTLGCGLLFGLGLCVSGMVDPAKVLGFLNVGGPWDPSLLLVMGGALGVAVISNRFVFKQPRPLWGERFALPVKKSVDGRLVLGAFLFGCGWGLAGICPGPSVTSLVFGAWPFYLFFAALLAGMFAEKLLIPEPK